MAKTVFVLKWYPDDPVPAMTLLLITSKFTSKLYIEIVLQNLNAK